MRGLSDKARAAVAAVVNAFERGDVAELCAQATYPPAEMPSSCWTMRNRWLAAMQTGDVDCRGFRQWKAAGRSVRKGERAAYILIPLMGKHEDAETGETTMRAYGFKGQAVFAAHQTDGEPLDYERHPLPDLPLLDVAEAWELTVSTTHGGAGFLGRYQHGKAIMLATPAERVFLHELCHAADDRLGTIKKSRGQDLHNEAVAELGAEVLRRLIGRDGTADTSGNAYAYIKSYATDHDTDVVTVCLDVLGRTADVVALILETSATIDASSTQDIAA